MPNLFFKINNTFTLQDNKDEKVLVKKYKKKKEYIIKIKIMPSPNGSISFGLSSENSVGGVVTSELENSKLKVVCEGIFKINVKPIVDKEILDKNKIWYFDSFGEYSDGLRFDFGFL